MSARLARRAREKAETRPSVRRTLRPPRPVAALSDGESDGERGRSTADFDRARARRTETRHTPHMTTNRTNPGATGGLPARASVQASRPSPLSRRAFLHASAGAAAIVAAAPTL